MIHLKRFIAQGKRNNLSPTLPEKNAGKHSDEEGSELPAKEENLQGREKESCCRKKKKMWLPVVVAGGGWLIRAVKAKSAQKKKEKKFFF